LASERKSSRRGGRGGGRGERGGGGGGLGHRAPPHHTPVPWASSASASARGTGRASLRHSDIACTVGDIYINDIYIYVYINVDRVGQLQGQIKRHLHLAIDLEA
jgi:hypothetical protein